VSIIFLRKKSKKINKSRVNTWYTVNVVSGARTEITKSKQILKNRTQFLKFDDPIEIFERKRRPSERLNFFIYNLIIWYDYCCLQRW